MTVPLLRLIDISAYQGTVDWVRVKNDGVSGGITKATEGVGWTDPFFSVNWTGIKAAGIARGCYHFSRPEYNSPLQEAAWFLSVVPALATYDLVALDLETGPADGSDLSAWALEWLEHVGAVLGTTPLLYTYLAFAQQRLHDARLAHFPLWLAAYQDTCPPSAGPWNSVALWQHTSEAVVAGVNGLVDESLIARTLDGLHQLGKPPGPRKVVVLKDMMLRSAPQANSIYFPVQMCWRGATLDVVGGPESGWVECSAGSRSGWLLEANCRYLS